MERKEGSFYRDKIIAVSNCKVSLRVAEKPRCYFSCVIFRAILNSM